jgi:rod shape determining protein RodA
MSVILSDGSKFLPWLKYHFLRMIAALCFFLITLAFILKEGDLGSAMVVVPVCVVMLVAGGVPFRYLIAGFLSAMIVLPIIYFSLKPQQQGRISVCYQMLMGQKVDALGSAWAATNTQIAIGSGGWEGKGIYKPQAEEVSETDQPLVHMTGIGKVPEKTSHDDFIFTVIAESFGFRVAGLLIMGFVFVFLLILMVSLFARDTLGRVLAAGITGLFLGHTFEHIGMNIGLLPITGIPLPLISYGGTFLLITMFLFGMVQSVWVHRNLAVEAEEPTKPNRSGVRNSPAISYAG